MMIEHPEFWSSLAFVIVVILACRPVSRWLSKWTSKQGAIIQNARDEAVRLHQQAKEVRSEYEKEYLNRFDVRQHQLKEAELDIQRLMQEQHQQTQERVAHQKQEMALRLKAIEENGNLLLKRQLAKQIVRETEAKLKQNPMDLSAEDVLQQAISAIDVCYQEKV